jgi:hypothetical protein
MKKNACQSIGSLLASALLMLWSTAEQAQAAFTPAVRTSFQASMQRPNERTTGDYLKNNDDIWSVLLNACSSVDHECAIAALYAASNECEASAKFFRKDTRKWQVTTIVLTSLSAILTGVGASTTIANAKIYSTLGGTTGLGAVSTTINSASNTDQGGLTAVNTVITKLQAFALGTGTPPTPPTDDATFIQARLYGAQCAAAATASPANNTPSTPSK